MDLAFHRKLQLGAAWCGGAYVVLLVIGWILVAGFLLPPHDPKADAAQIVQIFQADTVRIRIGMVLVMFAALLAIPFAAAVSQQIARIEGHPGILTYSALLGGAGLMILTFYPAIFWLVAAYRPDRAADAVYLMNDLAWLQFIGGVSVFLAMPISVAIAAFGDTRPEPLFPRWAGYYNTWVIVLIIPDQLLFFFHDGPFAWNGLFGLWIPASMFASWFFVTLHLLRNAISVTDRAQAQPEQSPTPPVQ